MDHRGETIAAEPTLSAEVPAADSWVAASSWGA
ncbi:hypothetical protein RHIZ404_230430 [Rhizobium sp. EC-SD404]|nr:hypothetical protein RHIZ404_230430 [Rhizobium sp. EC-SD404]